MHTSKSRFSVLLALVCLALFDLTPLQGTTLQTVLLLQSATAAPNASELDREFVVFNTKNLSGRLAFVTDYNGKASIFVLDLDSNRVRPLIAHASNNTEPFWSPDGSKITFTSDRDGIKKVYIADWDGAGVKRLSSKSQLEDHPAFNVTGDSIVYDSQDPTTSEVNLFSIAAVGGSVSALTAFSGRNSFGRWSPKGDSLVFVTDRHWPGSDLCLWNLKQRSESCLFQGAESYFRPTFSNSGTILVYVGGNLEQTDLFLMDLRTREPQKISTRSGRELDPTFSPDDKHVAFCGETEKSGTFNIFLLTSEKTVIPLLQSTRYSMRNLTWTKARTIELEVARLKHAE